VKNLNRLHEPRALLNRSTRFEARSRNATTRNAAAVVGQLPQHRNTNRTATSLVAGGSQRFEDRSLVLLLSQREFQSASSRHTFHRLQHHPLTYPELQITSQDLSSVLATSGSSPLARHPFSSQQSPVQNSLSSPHPITNTSTFSFEDPPGVHNRSINTFSRPYPHSRTLFQLE
jgi:hypothetical protein